MDAEHVAFTWLAGTFLLWCTGVYQLGKSDGNRGIGLMFFGMFWPICICILVIFGPFFWIGTRRGKMLKLAGRVA